VRNGFAKVPQGKDYESGYYIMAQQYLKNIDKFKEELRKCKKIKIKNEGGKEMRDNHKKIVLNGGSCSSRP